MSASPRVWLGRLLLLACCVVPLAPTPARAEQLLFYDPDANYSNFDRIIEGFQRALGSIGPQWQFQAVISAEDFETLVSREPTFAIVSSAYLKGHSSGRVQPLVIPAFHGDVWYHKKLLSVNETTAAELDGKTISVSGVGNERSATGKAVLKQLRALGVNKPIVMAVPKDVDSLMALSFAQVEAALVTAGSIDVIKRLNPNAAATFHELGETEKILRTPLCVYGTPKKEAQDALLAALARFAEVPGGREVMTLMVFDRWVPFNQEMLR